MSDTMRVIATQPLEYDRAYQGEGTVFDILKKDWAPHCMRAVDPTTIPTDLSLATVKGKGKVEPLSSSEAATLDKVAAPTGKPAAIKKAIEKLNAEDGLSGLRASQPSLPPVQTAETAQTALPVETAKDGEAEDKDVI